MPHAGNHPVVTQTDAFAIIGEACRPVAVQNETLEYRDKSAGNTSTEQEVLDSGLIPISVAAKALGIDPKRLLGYCFRNKLGDPISDGEMVYGWSCRELAKRLTNDSSVAP